MWGGGSYKFKRQWDVEVSWGDLELGGFIPITRATERRFGGRGRWWKGRGRGWGMLGRVGGFPCATVNMQVRAWEISEWRGIWGLEKGIPVSRKCPATHGRNFS